MGAELKKALQMEYRQAVNNQIEDAKEAQSARKSGDLPEYFDLMRCLQLADLSWALEKWDEAKRWYRQNAQILKEQREWFAQRDGERQQPLDGEANSLVKAGLLEASRALLPLAVEQELERDDSQIVLTGLGLHAAQAKLVDLTRHVGLMAEARAMLPGGESQAAKRAREILHYEPAQVALLLGNWDDFAREVASLAEGAALMKGDTDSAFPEPMQRALVATSAGFEALLSLRSSPSEPGRQKARVAFEEAMLQFYRFGGLWDHDTYFMRLNTRIADDIAAGRQPDVNPFSVDGES
jgi:hypothetical protein